MSTTIYSGPGKLFRGSSVLWPEAEHGQINYTITQEKDDAATAMHGRVASTGGDVTGKVRLTPFDNWSALGLLFPSYLGVSVGATAGALAIGTRPHNPSGAADSPATLWSADGRAIVINRTAVTRHPDLHLGVGKPLFGPCELTALVASGSTVGTAGAFHTITETAAADPGGQMLTTDFVREEWRGVWGTATGFGAHAGDTAMEAEEEWTLVSAVRYSALKVQKLTRALKLDSVDFMIKCRPFGPTWSNLEAAVLTGRAQGSRWANPGNDLVLTSASGKTITLKNCDVIGEGFEFGGTKLNTGEVGFITQMTFTAGAPNPLLVFSA